MRVKILKDCDHTGIKQGEVYNATPYSLDPRGKVVLESREPDGFDPSCTAYRYEVEILPISTEDKEIK